MQGEYEDDVGPQIPADIDRCEGGRWGVEEGGLSVREGGCEEERCVWVWVWVWVWVGGWVGRREGVREGEREDVGERERCCEEGEEGCGGGVRGECEGGERGCVCACACGCGCVCVREGRSNACSKAICNCVHYPKGFTKQISTLPCP